MKLAIKRPTRIYRWSAKPLALRARPKPAKLQHLLFFNSHSSQQALPIPVRVEGAEKRETKILTVHKNPHVPACTQGLFLSLPPLQLSLPVGLVCKLLQKALLLSSAHDHACFDFDVQHEQNADLNVLAQQQQRSHELLLQPRPVPVVVRTRHRPDH